MINKDENKPIYKQLVDEILEDIKQGRLNPEDKLPTERVAGQLPPRNLQRNGKKGI